MPLCVKTFVRQIWNCSSHTWVHAHSKYISREKACVCDFGVLVLQMEEKSYPLSLEQASYESCTMRLKWMDGWVGGRM